MELTYTLLGDGPTDQKLQPLVRWVLRNSTNRAISGFWADLSIAPSRPRTTRERIAAALEFYPSDILFVHRDAERISLPNRIAEIQRVIPDNTETSVIPLVPVRMTEAWFLSDEAAIRTAANNPGGRVDLALPPLRRCEDLPNPKEILATALETASDLRSKRHLNRFNVVNSAHRVAELTEDFSRLRVLHSFAEFESAVQTLVAAKGW